MTSSASSSSSTSPMIAPGGITTMFTNNNNNNEKQQQRDQTNEELKDIVLNVTQRVIANKKRVSVEDFESGEATAALSMGVMIMMIVFMIIV